MLQLMLVAAGLITTVVLAWMVFAGPSADKESARRLQGVRYRHSESTSDKLEAQLRRAVAARRPTTRRIGGSSSRIEALALRLDRSGTSWTLQQYIYASLGIGVGVAALLYLKSGAFLFSLIVGLFAGVAIPHFTLNVLIKRRATAFTSKFADAIELLVRGLRSGLPVTETLGVVATEVPGPVGEEFKLITERIKIGKTMDDALQNTADRLDMPEFSFFCITLAIQRETGGNLAETLANLADVLRKRAQMKLKIRAMSSESKASAYIVGALPFVVFLMIFWVNSGYITRFFVDERLIIAGLGGLIWMSIGAFIMAKMVSFEI